MKFESWHDAYAHCREVDHPVDAEVGGERGKVFPSGAFQRRYSQDTTPPEGSWDTPETH